MTFVSDGGEEFCGIEGEDLEEGEDGDESGSTFSAGREGDLRLPGPMVDSMGYRKYNPIDNTR